MLILLYAELYISDAAFIDKIAAAGYNVTKINRNLAEMSIMKCPFCGEDMEHGFLYSSQRIGFPWFPDGEKPMKYIPEFRTKKKGGMVFGKTKFEPMEFDTLSFYVCKKCMKGIADSLTEKR